jgi:hypothetical protein
VSGTVPWPQAGKYMAALEASGRFEKDPLLSITKAIFFLVPLQRTEAAMRA